MKYQRKIYNYEYFNDNYNNDNDDNYNNDNDDNYNNYNNYNKRKYFYNKVTTWTPYVMDCYNQPCYSNYFYNNGYMYPIY